MDYWPAELNDVSLLELSVVCAALIGRIGEGSHFTISDENIEDFMKYHADGKIGEIIPGNDDCESCYLILFDCECSVWMPESVLEKI